MKTKEEILSKRIIKFPEGDRRLAAGAMTDEAIKRNVYAAMEEYATQFKDSPYQGSAGTWVKASERLPEFVNKDKKYIVRYIKIPDELEVWNWDWINERQAAQYDFEWLDDSAASPAGDGEAIEILKELCWLKSHKENVGKDSMYQQRQPEAWKRANEFLNRLVTPPNTSV